MHKFLKNNEFTPLVGLKGSSFGSVSTNTVVPLKGGKKNPYQGRITKQARQQVMFFGDSWGSQYEKVVNKRLADEGKEATFKAGSASWGKRVSTGLVYHVDKTGAAKYYLEFIKIGKEKAKYFLDGNEITYARLCKIEGYDKPVGAAQGGLIRKVEFRRVNFDNVTGFAVNKIRYTR